MEQVLKDFAPTISYKKTIILLPYAKKQNWNKLRRIHILKTFISIDP